MQDILNGAGQLIKFSLPSDMSRHSSSSTLNLNDNSQVRQQKSILVTIQPH